MSKDEKPGQGQLTVQVHDEDAGGKPIELHGGPGEKVSKIISELYDKLNTQPKPSDRLLCEATGESVLPHAEEHLRDYAASRCSALVWTFARDTGGA